jgi:hypothetical protein
MIYPPDFDIEAKNAVERQKVLANKAFEECLNGVPRNSYLTPVQIADCARKYVMRVVLAFALEACELVESGKWSAADTDAQVHLFLEQVAREAQREKRFNHDGSYLKEFTFYHPSSNSIMDSELRRLKALPDWKKYQDALLRTTEKRLFDPLVAGFMEAQRHLSSSASHNTPTENVFGDRLDRLADTMGGHDAVANAIPNVSRSSYFEVKRGRGGKKVRRAVADYLESLDKAGPRSSVG